MTAPAHLPPHVPAVAGTFGTPIASAIGAVIMVHGRGGTAASILELAPLLRIEGVAFLAPQATGNTWYPNSFLFPIASNEPGISSAMAVLDALFDQVAAAGIATEHTALLGFSQGACLSLEYVARHARRYGAVFGLSGGLIGPEGTPRDYAGALDGTPVFLGCSDVDAHIPLKRVHETHEVLARLGATVDERIYPGMGHLVNADEIEAVRSLLGRVMGERS